LTAASVLDFGCVPPPCSLDASVAGFSLRWCHHSRVREAQGCEFDYAASVFEVGCVPSPCSLDASVAGF